VWTLILSISLVEIGPSNHLSLMAANDGLRLGKIEKLSVTRRTEGFTQADRY
jgi:hypothetical protein